MALMRAFIPPTKVSEKDLKPPNTESQPPLNIAGMVFVKNAVKDTAKKLLMSLQKKKSGWLKDAAKTPMTLTQPLLISQGW